MSTRLQRTADKSLNEKHAKILKDCLQKPENKNCADCKRKDPRWASWNLGIFVCINCSGVHRSMGTHISRVKSVDLDNWTPEQVENVVRWGNGKANAYWEANLKNSKPSERNIDYWIRSKYEAKKWAMSGPIPDPDTFNDNAYLSESTSEKTLEKTSREEIKNEKSPKIQNKENNTFDLFMSAPQSSSSNNVSSQQQQQKNSSKLHGSEFFSIGKQSTFTGSILPPPQDSSQTSTAATTTTTTSRPATPNNNSSGELSNHHNTLKSSIMSLYNSPSIKPTTTITPQSIPGLSTFNISPHGSNTSLNSLPSSTTTNDIALDSKNLMMPQGGQYFTTFSSSSQQSLSSNSISSPTIETKPSSKHNNVFDDLFVDFPQYK